MTCFNGAALRRARRYWQRGTAVDVQAVLQRGRAPKSAEMRMAEAAKREAILLQRGRAPKSAEMRDGGMISVSIAMLQRGRAPKSAEIVLQ